MCCYAKNTCIPIQHWASNNFIFVSGSTSSPQNKPMPLQKVECRWPCTYLEKYFGHCFAHDKICSLQRMFKGDFIIYSLHCKYLYKIINPWPVETNIILHLVFSPHGTWVGNSRCLIRLKVRDYILITTDDMILLHQNVQLNTTKS